MIDFCGGSGAKNIRRKCSKKLQKHDLFTGHIRRKLKTKKFVKKSGQSMKRTERKADSLELQMIR